VLGSDCVARDWLGCCVVNLDCPLRVELAALHYSLRKEKLPPEIETLPKLEVIIASLFYLMSRYAHSPSKEVALAASGHFELLRIHPESDGSRILQDVGRRLMLQWRDMGLRPVFTNEKMFLTCIH